MSRHFPIPRFIPELAENQRSLKMFYFSPHRARNEWIEVIPWPLILMWSLVHPPADPHRTLAAVERLPAGDYT